ncbi:proteasome-type protease [soil metagenome]
MRLEAGIVFLSDSRTNAGVDQISTFRKMTVFERPGDRVMVLMTSGNLAVSQAVVQWLRDRHNRDGVSLWNAPTMFEAVQCVGEAVRAIYERDAEQLAKFDLEFNCRMIFGGQIAGEPQRLFSVYSAGNFIEATPENPYFQIGESKYGKPIIDRVISPYTPLDEAAKCALISMDSTLRSNISVGLPLDLLVYEADSLRVTRFARIDQNHQYFEMIHRTWGRRLKQVFAEIPDPVWSDNEPHADVPVTTGPSILPLRVRPPSESDPLGETKVHSALQTVAEDSSGKSKD